MDEQGKLAPMKHRDEEDYRDVPLPSYVTDAIPEDFEGFPALQRRRYGEWFTKAAHNAGVAELTPHGLRHIFASVALAAGIPITDVSRWLGHKNIQVTFGIYGHLVPESDDRARFALDDEWAR